MAIMLTFACPSCNAKLQMPEDLAGKKVRCSSCKEIVMAPERESSDAIQSGAAPAAVAAGKPRSKADAGPDDDRDDDRPKRGSRNDGAKAATMGAGIGVGAILLIVLGGGACLLVPCIGIALLVPAVQKVRESANRALDMNCMKQMTLACHSFNMTHGTLPTPKAFMPPQGTQPVDLSWRVSILPFIEQQMVFGQFDHVQAWNSPRNLPVSNTVILTYHNTTHDPQSPTTMTRFQYFTGPNTLWPNNNKRNIAAIPDGTSNTFLFAEAASGVPWAQPADMTIVPGPPLPMVQGRVLVAMCDASVHTVDRARVTDTILLMYIDPADGNPVPPLE
jgi:hypothetical protein